MGMPGPPANSYSQTIVIAVFSGLMAGMVHVVSGPDHLAAIAPMAANSRRRAWTRGLEWGGGHATGILVIGLLSLLLRDAIAVEMVSSWSERLVGVALIGIGLWGLRQVLTHRIHTHEHTHEGIRHVHVHLHSLREGHDPKAPHQAQGGHRHGHGAFWMGGLHGLAGGSHFLVVIPALAFPSALQTVGFLVSYGLGTVMAMLVFSSVMGELAGRFARLGARAYGTFLVGCSVLAMAIGGWWLVG